MKQLFETDELIGKTIKSISPEFEHELIIAFTDETFTVIINDSGDGYLKNEIGLASDDFDIQPNRQNYEQLYKASLISKYVFDELDKYFKQMSADEANEKKQNQRAEEIHKLQQLAQKYPEAITKFQTECGHLSNIIDNVAKTITCERCGITSTLK